MPGAQFRFDIEGRNCWDGRWSNLFFATSARSVCSQLVVQDLFVAAKSFIRLRKTVTLIQAAPATLFTDEADLQCIKCIKGA